MALSGAAHRKQNPSSELQSVGEVRELEAAIAAEHPALTAGLRQERRVMRLRQEQPSFTALENGDHELIIALPKGTYATTLLSELAVLDDA